jgi:predicted regulator of Ras-like GTPase activity (Roadblock/LC7/MglB family)
MALSMGCVSVGAVAETAQALADLTEISAQVQTAVVLDREGTVLAATLDDERAGRLAASALELLRAAEEQGAQAGVGAEGLAQLDVALQDGSVFVVRDGDRLIAATTTPEPTVGLVFYDLKSCLRGLGDEADKPKRAPAKRPATRTRKKKDAES